MQTKHKRQISEQVLKSKAFYRSNIYYKLLDYLVRKNLKDEIPKEITIAIDVFDKGNDFNPSEDTTVRVHIHNLRKKLTEYYHEEGKDDPVRLSIPKGHYQLFFEEIKPTDSSKKVIERNNKKIWFAFLFSAVAWLVLLIFFLKSNNSYILENIDQDNSMWSQYFNNELPTTIVIGDFLVFHETDGQLNRRRRIQDYEINKADSLTQYINNYPDREIEKWVIGELPHNSIFNIVDILPVFVSFDIPFDIAFTSEIDIDFIKNRNIIYIGEFKNLRVLENLTSALPFEIKTLPWWDGKLTIKGDSSYTLQTYHKWEKSRYIVDLGMIAKLPGQNGENYLICAGFGYNSQINLIKLLATKEGLAKIENTILDSNNEIPEYFVSILEISGFDRASTKAEIKFVSIIPKDYFNKTLSTN